MNRQTDAPGPSTHPTKARTGTHPLASPSTPKESAVSSASPRRKRPATAPRVSRTPPTASRRPTARLPFNRRHRPTARTTSSAGRRPCRHDGQRLAAARLGLKRRAREPEPLTRRPAATGRRPVMVEPVVTYAKTASGHTAASGLVGSTLGRPAAQRAQGRRWPSVPAPRSARFPVRRPGRCRSTGRHRPGRPG